VVQPSPQTNTGFAADEMGVYPIGCLLLRPYVDLARRLHTTVYGGASPAPLPFCTATLTFQPNFFN
jgi:hypothetical protein